MNVLQLSDFCETGSGGTPNRSRQSEYYDGGTIPWVKSGELARNVVDSAGEFITEKGLSESSAKLLQPGAILIAMYGATVGQVSRLTIRAATNQAICYIYPDEAICVPDYLYRVLKGAKARLLAKRVGGGQPNISQKILRGLRVPLPPLDEQKRIAGISGCGGRLAGQAPRVSRPARHPPPIHLPRQVRRPRHQSDGVGHSSTGGLLQDGYSLTRRSSACRAWKQEARGSP